MPRKRQYGFIFNNLLNEELPKITKTIAHELGHGAFRFQHWWEVTDNPQETTDNLMDYRPEGTELRYHQWEVIRNPPWVATVLDEQEDAAFLAESAATTWTRNLNELACAHYQGKSQIGIDGARFAKWNMPWYQHKVGFDPGKTPASGHHVVNVSSQAVVDTEEGKAIRYSLLGNTQQRLEILVPEEEWTKFSRHLFSAKRAFFRSLIRVVEQVPEEDQFEFLAQLPSCSCELLTPEQRLGFLRRIAAEKLVWQHKEQQIVRLVQFTPEQDRAQLLADLAADPELLHELFFAIDGRDRRNQFVSHLAEFWRAGDVAALKEQGAVIFNFTRGGLWDKVQDEIHYSEHGDRLSFHEAYKAIESQDRGRYVVQVEVIRTRKAFEVAPLDPVYVKLPESEVAIIQPALAVKNFTDQQNREQAVQQAWLAVDGALLLVGVGEVAVGFRALRAAIATRAFSRELISLALGAADLSATTFSAVCGASPEARNSEFCHTWDSLGPYIEVGLLSASVVDLAYGALRRNAGDLIENGNLPDQQRLQLEEMFPGVGNIADIRHVNLDDFNALVPATTTVRAGGKRAINNVRNLVNQGKALVIVPLENSLVARKVDDYIDAFTAGNSRLQGELGEEISEILARELDAGPVLNIKVNESGHGFDAMQFEESLETPTVIRAFESKPLNGTSVVLPSTRFETQMSTTWKRAKIDEMLVSQDDNIRALGEILDDNEDLIEGYIMTIDKQLKQVIFIRLDSF